MNYIKRICDIELQDKLDAFGAVEREYDLADVELLTKENKSSPFIKIIFSKWGNNCENGQNNIL